MSVPAGCVDSCPLCGERGEPSVAGDGRRDFLRCTACRLVFVAPHSRLTVDDELRRYALHNNTTADAGYVAYLSTVADAVQSLSGAASTVLDFGCGEHQVLSGLLTDRGIACSAYDPLYGIGADALDRRYDVVVMCEVIEHLRDLSREVALIGRLVARNGFVVVRTQVCEETTDFRTWWYAQDPTHILFFTMPAIAEFSRRIGRGSVQQRGSDVFVLGPGSGHR